MSALSRLAVFACVFVSLACPSRSRPSRTPLQASAGLSADVDISPWRTWPRANSELLYSRAHGRKYVNVHVEPKHLAVYQAGKQDMPVGARVIKAVYEDLAGTRLATVQVMAKMPPGYDDWYYAVYLGDGKTLRAQGKIGRSIRTKVRRCRSLRRNATIERIATGAACRNGCCRSRSLMGKRSRLVMGNTRAMGWASARA